MKAKGEKKEKLIAEITRLEAQKEALIAKASIHSRAAKTISCPHCEKKLVRAEIEGERCPGCGADLRSFPMREKIALTNERLVSAKTKLTEMEDGK